VQVIHQCGDNPVTGDRAWLEERRAALSHALAGRYTLKPWIGEELAAIYAAATLTIGRAGAGTVNECCHLRGPALYIPPPGSSGDEQMANARVVERAGGCAVLPQSELTPARLVERVTELLADRAALRKMGDHARTIAVPDAAEHIVDVLLSTARRCRSRSGHADRTEEHITPGGGH